MIASCLQQTSLREIDGLTSALRKSEKEAFQLSMRYRNMNIMLKTKTNAPRPINVKYGMLLMKKAVQGNQIDDYSQNYVEPEKKRVHPKR